MLGEVTPGSKAALGRLEPRMALLGLSVVEQVQPIQPQGQRHYGAWLDPSLGREDGRGWRSGT